MRVGRSRPSRGFSLLETLFALALLAGIFLIVVGIFPASSASVIRNSNLMQATLLAQQILEQQRHLPFDSITDASGSASYSGYNDTHPSTMQYNWTTTVTTVVTGTLKDILITVTWRDASVGGSMQRTLQLETRVTRVAR